MALNIRLFALRPARLAGALLAGGLGFAAGNAQSPSEETAWQQSLLVEAQRLAPGPARERATQFVRTTGVASGQTPTARWVDPVCPRVIGIQDEAARSAEARIRAIAELAGTPVAGEPCDSNLVVSFAPNPASVVREIGRRAPGQLAQVAQDDRDALLNGDAPIRWWYRTELRERHGGLQQDNSTLAGGTTPSTHDGSGAGTGIAGGVPSLMHYESSVLSTLTQRALTSATVVIDQDRVMGLPLNTLAAYAALVGLAEIRKGDAAPEGSILSLFGAQPRPQRLTTGDMAFLRALYRMPLDREANRHRGTLVHDMTAALEGD